MRAQESRALALERELEATRARSIHFENQNKTLWEAVDDMQVRPRGGSPFE